MISPFTPMMPSKLRSTNPANDECPRSVGTSTEIRQNEMS